MVIRQQGLAVCNDAIVYDTLVYETIVYDTKKNKKVFLKTFEKVCLDVHIDDDQLHNHFVCAYLVHGPLCVCVCVCVWIITSEQGLG